MQRSIRASMPSSLGAPAPPRLRTCLPSCLRTSAPLASKTAARPSADSRLFLLGGYTRTQTCPTACWRPG
eukprot:15441229-Alexandrium_andersonii.AAC.1